MLSRAGHALRRRRATSTGRPSTGPYAAAGWRSPPTPGSASAYWSPAARPPRPHGGRRRPGRPRPPRPMLQAEQGPLDLRSSTRARAGACSTGWTAAYIAPGAWAGSRAVRPATAAEHPPDRRTAAGRVAPTYDHLVGALARPPRRRRPAGADRRGTTVREPSGAAEPPDRTCWSPRPRTAASPAATTPARLLSAAASTSLRSSLARRARSPRCSRTAPTRPSTSCTAGGPSPGTSTASSAPPPVAAAGPPAATAWRVLEVGAGTGGTTAALLPPCRPAHPSTRSPTSRTSS